jgi:hypothetical protein
MTITKENKNYYEDLRLFIRAKTLRIQYNVYSNQGRCYYRSVCKVGSRSNVKKLLKDLSYGCQPKRY